MCGRRARFLVRILDFPVVHLTSIHHERKKFAMPDSGFDAADPHR